MQEREIKRMIYPKKMFYFIRIKYTRYENEMTGAMDGKAVASGEGTTDDSHNHQYQSIDPSQLNICEKGRGATTPER